MFRWTNILLFILLAAPGLAQETRIVDSLQSIVSTQQGRDKVLTMIELTWEFYDVSYDDCLDWGERAIKEAQTCGYADLEAKAHYALGIQYAFHAEMDLAKEYLQKAHCQFVALHDTKNAFESLWNIATYELAYGSIDTAYRVYEEALPLAEQLNDSSAYADVIANMALILYKRDEKTAAYEHYAQTKRWYEAMGNEQRVVRTESNMAAISMELGQAEEARRIYWRILPKFEAFGDNHFLFLACKNLGIIYENSLVNFDSAMFYLQKAIDCTDNPMLFRENDLFLNNEKSGALVEMANILMRQGLYHEALGKYEEALSLAENSGFLYGQMEACIGLGKVYSQMGQAQKSMQCFQRYFELEKASDQKKLRPTFRKALALDYARLGMTHDLEKELSDFEEDLSALTRENQDIYQQYHNLQSDASILLQQYETQNQQLDETHDKMTHYRLAFFGLLAFVLASLVLLAARKIVRKNRPKM